MNRNESPSMLFTEAPQRRSLERRLNSIGRCVAIIAALSVPLGQVASANTQVFLIGGNTDLTAAGSYVGGAVPASGNDLVLSGLYNPATLTVGPASGSLSIGTLDDFSPTALTIAGQGGAASTLTLNGGVDSVVNSQSGDLLYVGTGDTLTIQNGAGTLGLTLATAGNFDVQGTATISSAITDGGNGLAKSGAGTLTLSALNSAFTGPLSVNGGTLSLTGSAGSSVLNVGGGTFAYSPAGTNTQGFTTTSVNTGASVISNTIATDTLNLGTLAQGGVGATVDFTSLTGHINTITANTATSILGGWATTGGGASWAVSAGTGAASGAISALAAGSYTNDTWASGNNTTVTLATNTAYTGVTTNSLRFNTAAADTVTLAGTDIITSGGILVTPTVGNNASTITGGTLEGSAGGALYVNEWDTNSNLTINSVIANNTSATGLIKSGPGALVLGGSNVYTGVTQVNAGTLTITGATAALGTGGLTILGGSVNDNSANTNALGSAAINLGGVASSSPIIFQYSGFSNLSFVNPINVNAGNSGSITIETTSGGATFNGLLTVNNNLTLVNTNNTGGSTLIFAGGVAGTGNLDINVANSNNSVNISGGTVNFTGAINNLSNVTSNSSTATVANVSANLTGAESLLNDSTSQMNVSGSNTNTGTTTVALGTIEFTKQVALYNNGTANGGWTAANINVKGGGTLAFADGTGGFTGPNIITLDGLGTSSGGFQNGSFLGVDTGSATLNFTSTGAAGGTGLVIANTNGGANVVGLTKIGANSLILEAGQTYTGPTNINAGTLQLGTGAVGQDASLATPSVANNGTLLFEPSAGVTDAFNGNISGGGSVTVNGNATGTVILGGSNTYTGATTITSGTLDVTNQYALQNSAVSPSTATNLTFDSSVTANAFTVGAIGANAAITLQNTGGAGIALTVGNVNNSPSTTTSGVLSGLGSLTVAGYNSTFTTTAANTYQGSTTVTGATLNLGGASANGSISSSSPLVLGGIDNGGTLAYTRTGTVSQTFNGTTINAGGNAITESSATQTINLGAITDNPGGTVDLSSVGTITTTNGNNNGILGGYATYGGKTTWAVAPSTPGGAITGLSSYTESGTALTTPANYLNNNVDVNASETFTAPISPNSIRFNTATGFTLTLSGVNTIQSGGILVTPTATAGSTISGGFLTGPVGGQLAINAVSNNTFITINSQIEDNGPLPLAVSFNATSGGRALALNNTNNSFSGGLYLNGGGVNVSNGGTALGVGTVTFGNNLFTGPAGGGLVFGTSTIVNTSGLIADADSNNTSNGVISGNSGGIWVLNGIGTATFAGIIGSYSGGRVADLELNSGTEIIGNTQAGSNAVIVNGGTFQVGTGYWGAFSNGNNNVALDVGGGTYLQYGNFAGTTSQTYNSGLAVLAGNSQITVNSNNGGGTVLAINAINRLNGGTVNFTLPTADGGAQDAINGVLTTTLNTNGIIGGYATVNGTDWAFNAGPAASNTVPGLPLGSSYANGSNIIALPAANYTNDTWAGNDQTTVTTNDTPASGSVTNSLRFNAAGANTVTLAGVNTITSGGILVTNNVGANATTITGGTLDGAANADLIVIQNNTGGGLTISSQIGANGTAGLTKSGPGLLTLNPASANTFTGGIYLNGGILNTTSNGIGAAGSLAFNGGTLQAASAITSAKAVTLGVNGGTIDTQGNTVTFSGNVTNFSSNTSGNAFAVQGAFNGAGAFGGFVNTGVGLFTKAGSGTLILSGAANGFGGGIAITNGTVQDGATAAGTLGTGYITFANNGNVNTLDLNGNSATIAGLIGAGTNGIVTSSGIAGSTSTLTMDGVFSETFAGNIQNGVNGGAVALTENLNNATQTVTLLGNDTYTGATTITSGVLQIGNGSNGSVNSSAFTVSGTGTLAFDEATGSTINGTIVNNGAVIGNEGAGITNTLAGAVSGTGSFTQTGLGTTILANSNSRTGPTTLTAGTVIVSGSLTGTASVAVGAGSKFEVNGSVYGGAPVNVTGGTLQGNNGTVGNIFANNGSNVAPGLTTSGPLRPGTLTANTAAFDSTSSLSIRIGVLNGNDNDQLVLAAATGNSLSLNNTPLNISTGSALNASDIGLTYIIVNGGAGSTGNNNDVFSYGGTALADDATFTTPSGYTFQIIYGTDGLPGDDQLTGNDVALNLVAVAVPEPGTWGMILSGIGMLALLRRRRRAA